jgi:hypothetical protein
MTWCGHCGADLERGEPDPCLGRLPGVVSACCGHGERRRAYVLFANGCRITRFRVERNDARIAAILPTDGQQRAADAQPYSSFPVVPGHSQSPGSVE